MPLLQFSLRERGRVRCKKFKVTGFYYELDVSEIPEDSTMPQVLKLLENLFNRIVEELLYDKDNQRRIPETDRVRFAVQTADLKYEIFVPNSPPSELLTDRILIEIEKVLQSNAEWNLHGTMKIRFVHAPLSSG